MKEFFIELITPSKTVFTGKVESINLPGVLGNFQVLSNHAPMISAFEIGKITLRNSEGIDFHYSTSGGFAEVLGNKVLVLSSSVESLDEIDTDRARNAAERAKARISKSSGEKVDISRAELSLARAINRLKLSGK